MHRATKAWARVAPAAVLLVASCQVVAGLKAPSEEAPSSDASAVDASAEATSPADAGRAVDPCDETTLVQPTAQGGGSARVLELVFDYLDFATHPPPTADVELCATSGFRLDHQRCDFVDDAPGTPDDPVAVCRQSCGNPKADRVNDNAGGDLFGTILDRPTSKTYGLLPPIASLESGGANTLLRIRNYNERDDDDSVDLEFFALSGLAAESRPFVDASLPDGGFAGVDAGAWQLAWDRRTYREWTVDTASLAELTGETPKYRAIGFVRQHVLFARVPRLPLSLSGLGIVLDSASFVGELVPTNGGHWSVVRGRIGGDLPLSELAARLPSLAAFDSTVCANVVKPLNELACGAHDRGTDGGACDAVSLGVSFGMIEGTLGLPRTKSLPTPNCEVAACTR